MTDPDDRTAAGDGPGDNGPTPHRDAAGDDGPTAIGDALGEENGALARVSVPWRTPDGDVEWFTVLGGVGVAVFLVVAVFGPTLAPYPDERLVGEPFEPPSDEHLLGTDDAGRDILSLLLIGARVSMVVGLVAGTAAVLVGTAVGVTAGVAGGRVETALMRVVDVVLTIPFLPLIIVVAAVMGPGLWTTIGVLAAVMWARPARELRSEVLSIREREYIEAARAMGASAGHVAVRYVVPGVILIVIAQYARAVSMAVLLEAALSFLGLGDPTRPSWGSMLFWAQQRSAFLTGAWKWWVVPPGLAITASVLSFIFVTLGVERHAGTDRRSIATSVPGMDVEIRSGTAGPDPAGAPAADGGDAESTDGSEPTPTDHDDGDAESTDGSEPTPTDHDDGDAPAALAVEHLTVEYGRPPTVAVDDVSIELRRDEVLGVVGESGSGKSSVALALLDLLRPPGRVTEGRLTLHTDGEHPQDVGLADLRGDDIGFVPQEAMNALDPRQRLRAQVVETVRVHRDCSRETARDRATETLEAVGLPPESHGRYPFELSGGMRQRGVIAAALVNDPDVLVVDEPTTGLDVVTKVRTLELLEDIGVERDLSVVVISHDLAAVVRIADRIAVMSDGRVLEVGDADRLQTAPDHPYTERLLAARTPLPAPGSIPTPTDATTDTHLRYDGVSKAFDDEPVLQGVDLALDRGRSVALLGESGAGKSTLGRMALGLVTPDTGTVKVDGRSVGTIGRRELGRDVHYVFQDAYSSLPPNRRIAAVVAEPLAIHEVGDDAQRRRRVDEVLAEVGLTPTETYARRYPAELSGGERQRVAFARALVSEPSLLVADEPTSMLDAPLQRSLLELLYDLVDDRDITLLHITHDVSQAATYADELAVLDGGEIVERGPVGSVLSAPDHDATRTLLAAAEALSGSDGRPSGTGPGR